MSGRLDGKVAVVTGSGRGIGRAVAHLMSAEGASIVTNGRSTQSDGVFTVAADVAREVNDAGGRATHVYADVGTVDGARQLIEAATDAFGGVDILVNNAGGATPPKTVEDLPEDEWDEMINGNLKSQYACCHFAIPLMKASGWGRIVNVGSNAGLFGRHDMPAYAAAKAGVIGFTFSVAKGLSGTGVTANCLLPTASSPEADEARLRAGGVRSVLPHSPVRIPEAIAPLITYLCSEPAGKISGQVFYAAGGQVTWYPWPPSPRTMVKPTLWTLDELDQVFPRYFGSELSPTELPSPLT